MTVSITSQIRELLPGHTKYQGIDGYLCKNVRGFRRTRLNLTTANLSVCDALPSCSPRKWTIIIRGHSPGDSCRNEMVCSTFRNANVSIAI